MGTRPLGSSSEFLEPLLKYEEWAYQKESWVFHEGGFISLYSMSDELKYPAADKESDSPAPIDKEDKEGDHNRRYSYEVGGMIQGMIVVRVIAINPILNRPLILCRGVFCFRNVSGFRGRNVLWCFIHPNLL